MTKVNTLVLLAAVLALTYAQVSTNQHLFYPLPISVAEGKTEVTLFEVSPQVDILLKREYWYYLRNAITLYEASVDSPNRVLFFTIYRNIVGTFLVISTWTKTDQVLQINTFVRLGNGFEEGSGANYDPVNIDPFVVTLALGPDEFMVVVNEDGTVTVTGNTARLDAANGVNQAATGTDAATFNITSDMQKKCAMADAMNREKYWYYLEKAELVSQNHIPTTEQYYCVFVYLNVVGTFLSISSWNLASKSASVNTLVRLGNGKAEGANYGPVQLTPAILHIDQFN